MQAACRQQQHAGTHCQYKQPSFTHSTVLARPALPVRHKLRCYAQQQQKESQKTDKRSSLAPSSLNGKQGTITPQQEEQGWRLFDWSAWQQPWDVPWGPSTIASTMAIWVATFAGSAFLVMPAAYTAIVGKPLWELSPAGQADFALWSEFVQTFITFGIIAGVVSKYKPSAAQQLFNFNPGQPFKRGTGWLAWGLIGVTAAPIVVGSMALLLSAVGYDNVVAGGRGTVDGVAGMVTLDLPTYVRLVSVTGVLAPLLEETLFRGFLLTSLTKTMPTWAAVIASSAAFGIAHLSIRDLPVLFALGCWLGAIYCRSRNLLTPMLVHGAWNSTVLSLLFWLTANGVNVEKLIKEGGF